MILPFHKKTAPLCVFFFHNIRSVLKIGVVVSC